MNKIKVLGLLLIALAFAVPISVFLGIASPADYAYNQRFQSHVDIAYHPSSFDNLKYEVNAMITSIEDTWQGEDLGTVYGTWWYVDQNYANSVAKDYNYLGNLTVRLDGFIATFNTLQTNGSSATFINDFYSTTLANVLDEVGSRGGFLATTKNAYYYNFYPAAYWQMSFTVLSTFACAFFGFIFFVYGLKVEDEQRNKTINKLREIYKNKLYQSEFQKYGNTSQQWYALRDQCIQEYKEAFKEKFHRYPKDNWNEEISI